MKNDSPFAYMLNSKGDKAKYFLYYIIVFITSLSTSLLAILFKLISDYEEKELSEIILLSGAICATVLINSLFTFFRNYLPNRLALNKALAKKNRLLNCILYNDIAKTRKWESGELLFRINEDMGTIENFIGNNSVNNISLMISSVTAIILLLYLFPLVTIIAFCTTPVFLFVISKIGGKISENAKSIQENTTFLNQQLFESVDGNLEVQVFLRENDFLNSFESTLGNIKKFTVKLKKNNLNMITIGKMGNIIPILIIVFLGFYFVVIEKYTLGSWIAMFFLMEFSNSVFTAIPEYISSYKKACVSVRRLSEIEHYFTDKDRSKNIDNNTEKGFLRVDQLSFSYENTSPKVLKNINFEINKGQKVVIIGKSGCGKSTLVDLICGFTKGFEGNVVVNNNTGSSNDIISYADQESILFPGTIKENIILDYNRKSDMEQLFEKVIKMVDLETWINELPEKSDYSVGQKSNALSGGQRQKISLARALIKSFSTDSSILILDEATSSIDVPTEKEIITSIFGVQNLTCIFVAHRLTSYEMADRIILLDNGEILEDGTHQELVQRKGHYFQLLNLKELRDKPI